LGKRQPSTQQKRLPGESHFQAKQWGKGGNPWAASQGQAPAGPPAGAARNQGRGKAAICPLMGQCTIR